MNLDFACIEAFYENSIQEFPEKKEVVVEIENKNIGLPTLKCELRDLSITKLNVEPVIWQMTLYYEKYSTVVHLPYDDDQMADFDEDKLVSCVEVQATTLREAYENLHRKVQSAIPCAKCDYLLCEGSNMAKIGPCSYCIPCYNQMLVFSLYYPSFECVVRCGRLVFEPEKSNELKCGCRHETCRYCIREMSRSSYVVKCPVCGILVDHNMDFLDESGR